MSFSDLFLSLAIFSGVGYGVPDQQVFAPGFPISSISMVSFPGMELRLNKTIHKKWHPFVSAGFQSKRIEARDSGTTLAMQTIEFSINGGVSFDFYPKWRIGAALEKPVWTSASGYIERGDELFIEPERKFETNEYLNLLVEVSRKFDSSAIFVRTVTRASKKDKVHTAESSFIGNQLLLGFRFNI